MEKVRFAFRSAFGNEVEAALAEVEEWEAAREAGAVYYDRWKAEYDRAEVAEAERDGLLAAIADIEAGSR